MSYSYNYENGNRNATSTYGPTQNTGPNNYYKYDAVYKTPDFKKDDDSKKEKDRDLIALISAMSKNYATPKDEKSVNVVSSSTGFGTGIKDINGVTATTTSSGSGQRLPSNQYPQSVPQPIDKYNWANTKPSPANISVQSGFSLLVPPIQVDTNKTQQIQIKQTIPVTVPVTVQPVSSTVIHDKTEDETEEEKKRRDQKKAKKLKEDETEEEYESRKQRHRFNKQKKTELEQEEKKDDIVTIPKKETTLDKMVDEVLKPKSIIKLQEQVVEEKVVEEKFENISNSYTSIKEVILDNNITKEMDTYSNYTSKAESKMSIEQKSDESYSLEETILKLNCLAEAKKYEKLSTFNDKLEACKTILDWVPLVGSGSIRWLYAEGRDPTLNVIKKILSSAEKHSIDLIAKIALNDEKCGDYKVTLASLTTALSKAKMGVRNLLITYWDDDTYLAQLDVCRKDLSTRFFKNMYFRHSFVGDSDSVSLAGKQKDDSNNYFSFDETVKKLRCLAETKKNQKKTTSGKKLEPSKTILNWVPLVGEGSMRWLYGDGRDKTHQIIRKVIDSAKYHSLDLINKIQLKDNDCDDYRALLVRLTEAVSTSQTGIRNLIITYREDDAFLADLDVCFEDLEERFFKNMNFE
jgi:hypothetical protein